MPIRILSLGVATPPLRMTQEEVFAALGYQEPKTRRIFRESMIDTRHTWVDPRRLRGLSWQEMTQEYKTGAVALSLRAAQQAMELTAPEDISQITFCSVTGYTCPSLSYEIAGRLGLREDISHANLLGQGCEAALPGLEHAYDHVSRHGGRALTFATEICSATFFPAPEDDYQNTVANAIFSDAAVCAVVGQGDDPSYPEIVDFESCFKLEHLDLLGYTWQDGRLKVALSPDVPRIVPALIGETVRKLLRRHEIDQSEIKTWILHPGGKAVLRGMQEELGLEDHQVETSWRVMREHGNCSSATIGIVAKEAQKTHVPGYGIAVTMGAGTAVNAALLRWGE